MLAARGLDMAGLEVVWPHVGVLMAYGIGGPTMTAMFLGLDDNIFCQTMPSAVPVE